jgi:hypothetical protein
VRTGPPHAEAERALARELGTEVEAGPDPARRGNRRTRGDREDPALPPLDEEVDRLVAAEPLDLLETSIKRIPVEEPGAEIDRMRQDTGLGGVGGLDSDLRDVGGSSV